MMSSCLVSLDGVRKKEKEKEDAEKRALRKTTRKKLTLRHRRLVPRALLVHRDDRRVVFKPRLAHLAAVHLGFPALLRLVMVG